MLKNWAKPRYFRKEQKKINGNSKQTSPHVDREIESKGIAEILSEKYIEGVCNDKQKVVKLLWVYIQRDIKWYTHVDYILTKASQKHRIISVPKRSGFDEADLIVTFNSWISSIPAYACQVWHPGLTLKLVHDIERVQIRAMFIIHPHLSYWQALDTFGLTTLDEQRKILKILWQNYWTRQYFTPSFTLNQRKHPQISSYIRHVKQFVCSTNRSFVMLRIEILLQGQSYVL